MKQTKYPLLSFLTFLVALLVHPSTFAANLCYHVCIDEDEANLCEAEFEFESFSPHLSMPVDFEEYRKGEIYFKLMANTSIEVAFEKKGQEQDIRGHRLHLLIEKYGITVIENAFKRLPTMKDYYRVKFEKTVLIDELLRDTKGYKYIEFAEKVPNYRLFYTPNDIHANQWNVQKIEAEDAWDLSMGNPDIVIAIVDDAVRLDHEDLVNNIWTNPGEIAGNGVDDDGNGYTDDINGWDPADNDNDPNPPVTADDNNFSHGTHCAGIAAATTDNGLGIASSGFNVSIMAVKTADNGSGGLAAAFEGVEYAIAAGADIISMSWGGGPASATNQAVLTTAHDMGIILVAAAGNDNTDNLMYPASYEHVICVAATDDMDMKASFSNYGDSIDVAAPGVDIWSTVATSTSAYTSYDGTSMACPLVSGLAGLMLSLDPNLSPERLEDCLKTTADDISAENPGFDGQLGAGRINARKAMMCVPTDPLAAFGTDFIYSACVGQTINFIDQSGGINLTTWNWEFPGGSPASSTDQHPTVTYPADGTYNVTLTVGNGDPALNSTITLPIIIAPPTVTLSGDTMIFGGFVTYLEFEFTGTAPWNLTYTDGTTNFSETGITTNPLLIPVFPAESTTYSVLSFNDAACAGTASGMATIDLLDSSDCVDCPFYLIQEVLIGGGCLTVTNVTYLGDPDALGYFEQGPNLDIGFAEGIILASGNIETAQGPNNDGGAGDDLGFPGDPDLDNIVGGGFADTFDAAVIEFDFVPSESTLTFNYVFGSEEYLEFVDAGFNDVFGFFLSGPGIVGAQNIALIPGTATPVAIDNVNDLDFPAFYVNNEFGPGLATQYDGYTVPLTAMAEGLTPCETYHIKLAIADAGDGILDSGVFLEANSFSAGGVLDIAAVGALPGTFELYEGCEVGFFEIRRTDLTDLSLPFDVEYSVSGTATMAPAPDADFNELSGLITIPAGDTSVVLPIIVFEDGVAETPETITILLDNIECDCTTIGVSATLLVFDNTNVEAGEPVVICEGEDAQLLAVGGTDFAWTPTAYLNNPAIANPVANPPETTMYYVTATDANNCTATDSVLVWVETLPYFPDIVLDTSVCVSETFVYQLTDMNPISNYNYLWTPSTGLDNPNSPRPIATLTTSQNYTLTITNEQGCQTTQMVFINLEGIAVNIDLPDADICTGESVDLDAGAGFAAYAWSTGETTQMVTVSGGGDYTVTVSDGSDCTATDVVTVNELTFAIDVADVQTCPDAPVQLDATNSDAIAYEWDTGETTPTITATEIGDYTVIVTDANNCTAMDVVTVEELPEPTPEITGNVEFIIGSSTTLDAGTDFASYEWSTGETSSSIVVRNSGEYTVTVFNSAGCRGSISVEVTALLPPDLLIPSAFSPNGDGVNDEFKAFPGNLVAIEMYVYNRWGEKIFETHTVGDGWDGRYKGQHLNIGAYVYFGTATLTNGEVKPFKGNVTLVR